MEVKIGISNRHVHLCKKDLELLFGNDYELKVDHYLSQPGEFASTDRVTIKTPKSFISNVRVLGPIRNYTQVEISKTDAIKLRLNPPVRESGDLENSETIIIEGPLGEIEVANSCIIASRHIHLTNEDVSKFGLEGLDKVSVKLLGEKGGILDNVSLKVNDNYAFEMHLDTDDANAHLLKQGDIGAILIGENHE